eukprot:616222-Prorocentrum_lima.AAC.1
MAAYGPLRGGARHTGHCLPPDDAAHAGTIGDGAWHLQAHVENGRAEGPAMRGGNGWSWQARPLLQQRW